MGYIPKQTLRLDTIRKYTTLIAGVFSQLKVSQAKADGTFQTVQPLVRMENSNKALFRKIANQNAKQIITANDVYRYPLITYKLNSMTLDTSRLAMSQYKFEGDKMDESQTVLQNVAKYMKAPIPWDFSFQITMWSNLYDHLLNFAENFVYLFNPANTFTLEILASADNKFKLLHDTVLYIDSIHLPEPPDTMDENTNEPIQSLTANVVLKGIIIPPVVDAKVIKFIQTYFTVDDSAVITE